MSGRSSSGKTIFGDPWQAMNEMWRIIEPHESYVMSLVNEDLLKPNKIYTPVLRGLRPAISSADDIYGDRTRKDYFTDDEGGKPREDIEIFTGLTLYEELRSHLLGTLAERKLVSDYEKYLSEKFFESKQVTLIPKIDSDVLVIKIGQEFEKEIFHVGDGLQSLIAITFPIFRFSREKKDDFCIVCIEEPELLIHPGLQRTLMSELVSSERYKNIQFFITTHSNHFLDLTIDFDDISIFRVRKELPDGEEDELKPNFLIENVSNRDKQTLELLGVRNSSVFLANSTIWVEGITDRMYLGHALNLVQNSSGSKKYKEDNHYAFIEYGGSNLSHWDFLEEDGVEQIPLESVVSKIFLVADNDSDIQDKDGTPLKKGSKKQKRLVAIKEKFGHERFCQLSRREIENLIPVDILRKVALSLGSDVADSVALTYAEYRTARMGDFFESKFKIQGFKDKYGGIKNKKKFAELVLGEMTSVDSLSNDMREIAQQILTFVAVSNS